MIKFKSEIINLPIWYEDTLIGFVKNIIVDNVSGKILAFCTDNKCKKIIPFDELIFFFDRFFAKEVYPIFDSNEIIKIDNLLKENLNLGSQNIVDQKSNEYVGKLKDYSIDLTFGYIKNLKVVKSKFIFFKNSRLIDQSKIYSINPNIIYITENRIKNDKVSSKIKKLSKTIIKKKAGPILDPAFQNSTK